MQFDLGTSINYGELEREYSLYLPHREDPIKVTLRYAGPENKEYARKQRGLMTKYRQEAQRNQNKIVEITRRIGRELFPGLIVVKCEDVPVKAAPGQAQELVTITEKEKLSDFCHQLIPSLFDELMGVAVDLNGFTEASRMDEKEIVEVAEEVGKA